MAALGGSATRLSWCAHRTRSSPWLQPAKNVRRGDGHTSCTWPHMPSLLEPSRPNTKPGRSRPRTVRPRAKTLLLFALFASASNVLGACYSGCNNLDFGTFSNSDGGIAKRADARTTTPDAEPLDGARACLPGDVSAFTPSPSPGTVAPHQAKCSRKQLAAFVNCLHDFSAFEEDCRAWGFDPNKSLLTAFSGDCASCLFALPGKPRAALKVRLQGKSAFLELDEVACVASFRGTGCGRQALAAEECSIDACNESECSAAELPKCQAAARSGACLAYAWPTRSCIDGVGLADAGDGGSFDSGQVALGDSGTTDPAKDLCGAFEVFSQTETPDEVTYAFANYLCGE